jgi:dolichol-phosphate mannosyltransferase
MLPLDLRILVVDDASPDGTGDLAEELSARHPGRMHVLHRQGKLGLRSAYLEGFHLALGDDVDAIAQMDADLSHDPSALPIMAERIQTCDLVLGSRYVPGGQVDERWPLWRKGLSAWGNFYARTILGLPLHDVTTGYRLWRVDTLRAMPLQRIRASGYIFLVEMAYLAHCLEYRFAEVPIYFSERRNGKSKMSLQIQVEAALHVWQVLWAYRDLKRQGRAARLADQ